MFLVADSLKMWVSASNFTNGADYADECSIPFFQGSAYEGNAAAWGQCVLLWPKEILDTKKSPTNYPIYKISCGVKANKKIIQNCMLRKFKLPKFDQIHCTF